jgi:hypothetical protein
MNWHKAVGQTLDQDIFAALAVVIAASALFKPDSRSYPIVAFALGYFATQIPLLNGLLQALESKYIAQGLVSLVLVAVYSLARPNRYIVFSASCECVLILVNILWMMADWHQWYHWAIFGIINYMSLISLTINKWGARRGGSVVAENPRFHYPLHHVYGRRVNH